MNGCFSVYHLTVSIYHFSNVSVIVYCKQHKMDYYINSHRIGQVMFDLDNIDKLELMINLNFLVLINFK